jgi:hypothetical protein
MTKDLLAIQDMDDATPVWRRNFVRMIVPTFEGYGHCFREMVVLAQECPDAPELSQSEKGVLHSAEGYSAADRVKLSLKAMYRTFSITPVPDFGGVEWVGGAKLFDKRHDLMHPKSQSDLEISEESWADLRLGAGWLIQKHFDVIRLFREKKIWTG